jgi:YcxB-like protein
MSNNDLDASRELSVRGTLTVKEYKKFSSFHTSRWILWIAISTYMVFFPLLTYILYNPGDILNFGDMAAILLISSTASVCIAALIYFYAKVIIRVKATREYKSDQLIKNEFIYIFNDTGILQKRGRSINAIDWNEIVSIKEFSPLFLIYVSRNKAMVIPKRFFGSVEELTLFKRIINENVTQEKNKTTYT